MYIFLLATLLALVLFAVIGSIYYGLHRQQRRRQAYFTRLKMAVDPFDLPAANIFELDSESSDTDARSWTSNTSQKDDKVRSRGSADCCDEEHVVGQKPRPVLRKLLASMQLRWGNCQECLAAGLEHLVDRIVQGTEMLIAEDLDDIGRDDTQFHVLA